MKTLPTMANRISILFFLFATLVSNAAQIITLTDSTEEIWVSKTKTQYYIDSSNNYSIKDILQKYPLNFKTAEADLVNNLPNASYWIHFKVKSEAKAQSFRVEMYDFDINEIDFYTIEQNNSIRTEKLGYDYPFNFRKIAHKNPGFNISIPKDQTVEYFMRFKSNRLNHFKPVIKSYEKTLDYGLKEYLLLGVFYGLLLLMIFYNLLYYIILKKSHYLYYVLYASSILIYLMDRNGTAFQYLWPDSPMLNPYMDDLNLYVGTICMLLFTISFLDLKREKKLLCNIIYIAIAIRTILFVFGILSYLNFQQIITDAIFTQLVFAIGIKRYIEKAKAAKWFVFAFTILNIAFVVTSLENIGILPSSIVTVYSLNIGFILQFVFLSISIAESVKETYAQKNKAQSELLSFQEKINERLEAQVKTRTIELESQKELVEEKNNQIMASVRYAKTIQTATLPQKQSLNDINQDHFILYMPRDVVSGDFYWTYSLSFNEYLIAAADCTGHGIPGAFMSMIGINLLNRIVSEGHTEPNIILSELHKNIQLVLNQKESNNSDGMDIALCRVNKKEKIITYSGAKNPLIYILNEEVHKIKATRKSIGGCEQDENITFESHSICYKNSPIDFYLFSDGYADQFGGSDDQKFYQNNMISIFHKNHSQPLPEQKNALKQTIINWIDYKEQIDDILVIGIREN